MECGPCLPWVASARGRVVGWGCCKCELWFWSEHRHRGALGKALTVTVDAILGVQRGYERVHDSTMYAVRASINEMQRCQKGSATVLAMAAAVGEGQAGVARFRMPAVASREGHEPGGSSGSLVRRVHAVPGKATAIQYGTVTRSETGADLPAG